MESTIDVSFQMSSFDFDDLIYILEAYSAVLFSSGLVISSDKVARFVSLLDSFRR